MPRWTSTLLVGLPLLAACHDDPTRVQPPADAALNASIPSEPERVKWRMRLDGAYGSTPIVGADGTVYLVSSAGTLYAIEPAGSVRWTVETGGGGVWGLLALGPDGTIYVPGERRVIAVAPNGTRKWVYGLADYLNSGPAVGPDGNIYAVTDAGGIGFFSLTPEGTRRFAVDRFNAYGNGYSAMDFGPDAAYFALDMTGGLRNQPTFFSYDLDGVKRFERLGGAAPNASPRIHPNGNVLISAGGPLLAYRPDGTLAWSFSPQPSSQWSRPAVAADGVIYGVHTNAYLTAVNPNGTGRWTYFSDLVLGGAGLSPRNDLLVVGGRTNYGKSGQFLAVSTDGDPLWRVHLPDEPGFEPYGQLVPNGRPEFSSDGRTAFSSVTIAKVSTDPQYFYVYALDMGDGPPAPGNRPPVARINGPYSGSEGEAISFSSAGSSDPDGDVLTYLWDFGDGRRSREANPTFRYRDDGDYLVTLTVRDPSGETSTQRMVAVIANQAPTGSLRAPSAIQEGSAYSLTFRVADAGVADRASLRLWLDCGRGAGFQPVEPSEETPRLAVLACPVVPDQDTLTVRARVRDKDGGESEYARELRVVNAPPRVTFTALTATTIRAGGTVRFEGRFTDAGVEDMPWSYAFIWSDGTARTTGTTAAQGEPIVVSHTFRNAGTFTTYLRVTDRDGRAGRAALTVTVNP